jgi:hypothetical protein
MEKQCYDSLEGGTDMGHFRRVYTKRIEKTWREKRVSLSVRGDRRRVVALAGGQIYPRKSEERRV